jgi:hypothetical protein
MSIIASKVHDFSKHVEFSKIENDIKKKYKITNILEDEDGYTLYVLCGTIYVDYINKIANYEAYIEKGMDARMLMELRNNAIQRLTDEEFSEFDECKTPMEVVNKRAKVMRRFTDPTDDVVEPWQLYLISIKTTNVLEAYSKVEDLGFTIDFEWCYADGQEENYIYQ